MTTKMKVALVMLAIAIMGLGTKIFINTNDNDKQDNTKTAKVIEQKHFEYEYYEYDYPSDLKVSQNEIMHCIFAKTKNSNGIIIITIPVEPSVDKKIKIRNDMMAKFKDQITDGTLESFDKWGKYKGQGIAITDGKNTVRCFTTTGQKPCILIIESEIMPYTKHDLKALQTVRKSFNIK